MLLHNYKVISVTSAIAIKNHYYLVWLVGPVFNFLQAN